MSHQSRLVRCVIHFKMQPTRFTLITRTFSRLLALYSESLSRTYDVDSTCSWERSFRDDMVRRAAPSSSDPGCFSSLSLDQLSSPPAFPFMFAVRVGADCIWWGAYLFDSLPVTLTSSPECIPPSVPACWRTTYCPIDAGTFDALPFSSRRDAGSRTFSTNTATMRELPLDPRNRCSSAEYTTCHYA